MSQKFSHQFRAGFFDWLVRNFALAFIYGVSPDGLEGFTLDPRLLDCIVEWVGKKSVDIDKSLDGFDGLKIRNFNCSNLNIKAKLRIKF